ncbi:MAG: helix-turn-helix domain-containing protein [Clostridia bacterium]|nr:helix-turn-helix domain-containing protein [Clostridia bacterium]
MNQLKEIRKQNKLSQKELADMIPVNQTAISQWERGVTTPNQNALKRLCEIFNRSPNYFLDFDLNLNEKPKGIKIPVLGSVAAGIPISAIEDILDYEEISEDMAKTGEFFGLKIKGDSMSPIITNGDTVIVKSQQTADNGDIVIVLVNGDEATCKKIKKTPEGVMLIPLNSDYEPIFYSNKQIEQLPVRIIGKVVEQRRKF